MGGAVRVRLCRSASTVFLLATFAPAVETATFSAAKAASPANFSIRTAVYVTAPSAPPANLATIIETNSATPATSLSVLSATKVTNASAVCLITSFWPVTNAAAARWITDAKIVITRAWHAGNAWLGTL